MLLDALERGARLVRAVGLGALVERVGPTVGRVAARREVEVDGLRLAGDHAGQLFYLRELARGREAYLADLLGRAAPPGGVAVDVGAHIGYLTLRLARAVGPDGHVVAFEPDPGSRAALLRNLRRNGVVERVEVRSEAVGDRSGRARLHIRGGGETSSLSEPDTARESVDVDVVRLDDALADRAVDVVKLDIEGGEVAALGGMQSLVERSGERLVLFVECNPAALSAAGSSSEQLLGLLADAGLTVLEIDEANRRLVDPQPASADGYVNLVCAHEYRLATLERG